MRCTDRPAIDCLNWKFGRLVENDYGESVNAKWKCVGTIGDVSEMLMGTIGLNLDVHVYEHIIDGEEKYYIDIQKYIRRVDGVDQLEAIREGLGI